MDLDRIGHLLHTHGLESADTAFKEAVLALKYLAGDAFEGGLALSKGIDEPARRLHSLLDPLAYLLVLATLLQQPAVCGADD